MKKLKLVESKGKTFYIKGRGIPKGCKLCLRGEKAVLFLNGICQKPDHCHWYCPLSEERRDKNTAFADEIEISTKEDLLTEINTINAKGMSITGGEPLLEVNVDKTLSFIEYIKSVKGHKFHIHLYTNGECFNEKIAQKLALAGLDEIRFHPSKDNWDIIKYALNKGISVGAEVPVIPTEENIDLLKQFITFLDNIGVEFINLNEFEYCFPNSKNLKSRGFTLKTGTIASVKESKEFALRLIRDIASSVKLKIHFCSILSKDYFQLKNRYLRRAKTIKLPYETITEEGLLLYAQIEGDPQDLNILYSYLLSELKLNEELVEYSKNKIKLPFYIVIEDDFIAVMKRNDLKGFIEEIIPFRGKYSQITERTPIEVFKEDLEM